MKTLITFILLLVLFFPLPIYGQAYPPVPTGSLYSCILTDFQRPSLSNLCADCIYANRPDIRQLYNNSNHTACSNVQIYNHWCNGGLGLNAIADCNAIKNGICSQPSNQSCAVVTPYQGLPSPTPSPPATINSAGNPRGCGILYTSGVPSCWCNNGGGQGLCGNVPLDGIGGCRDLCERGIFVGPKGYTHCFMLPDNTECASNPDGTYHFCTRRCLPASFGYSQTVGCEYPNKTVFGKPQFDASCLLAFNKSSNTSFFNIFESFLKGLIRLVDVRNFMTNIVRVPGLQKVSCDPAKENCTFE